MNATNCRPAWFAVLCMVSVLVCVPEHAAAQAPPGPGDFSFAAWTGYAATRVDCENCAEGEQYGDTWELGLSPLWRINSKLLAGAELVLQPSNNVNDVRTSWLVGTLQFHPWAAHGFFIKGGYGLLWVRTTLEIDGVEQDGKFRGMVVNYGAGWQFRKDRRVSFAPFGAHYVATAGTVRVQELEAVNVVGNSWVAGVAVYFR